MLLTERLKAARKECKLTQQQVADMLNIDRSTYAYYELGVSNPSLDNLVSLAAVFKTDIGWLLGTDREGEAWRAPESDLAVLKSCKEKQMAELSKEERQIVALFRIANAHGKAEDFFEKLKEVTDEGKNEE
ncbi:MAG: helix-turn-helix transcriptional regulator [Clostridia bacterium]|nr:helix-turn-helix transcriptional regulator [Clostridia bacterium]